jgi:hypothetical protein
VDYEFVGAIAVKNMSEDSVVAVLDSGKCLAVTTTTEINLFTVDLFSKIYSFL